MSDMYDYQGNVVMASSVDYDRFVKAVAHRGYSNVAPENTLPAYKLAKQMGFSYVETDVRFTSDSVPVLLHDDTINRTSNGTGAINSMTWEQVQTYDFGSWKSEDYSGTKIPSFSQFIELCRNIGLYPYIELQVGTQAQIQGLVYAVCAHGMAGKVTWISTSSSLLGYVKDYDDSARLGYVRSGMISSSIIETVQALQTSKNEVFIDSNSYSDGECGLCVAAGLPLEIWTISTTAQVLNMNPYITGVTSNDIIAGKVLYEDAMS